MHTEKELKGLRKADLIVILAAMEGVTFSESATNAEMIELILAEEAKRPDQASDATGQPEVESGETENADKVQEETPDSEQAPVASSNRLTIKAKHKTGFYRCGRFWPHEGREIALSELSEKEVAALKAEKNLIVE